MLRFAALYISARIPSFPDALFVFNWEIAYLISSSMDGASSSFMIGCCGIWFRATGSIDEGKLNKLLKYSTNWSLNPAWSLIRLDPSEVSRGLQPDHDGP